MRWLLKLLGCRDEELKITIDNLNLDLLDKQREIKLLKAGQVDEFSKYLSTYPTLELWYTKRWLFASNRTYPMNVKDLLKQFRIQTQPNTLEDCFTSRITYIFDNFQNSGILDFWQFPFETEYLRGGDCEDSSILRSLWARNLGFNVKLALGFWGEVGHAFPLLYENGKIYVVEATSNKFEKIEIKNLQDESKGYKIHIVADERNCWQIRDGVTFGQLLKDFDIKAVAE